VLFRSKSDNDILFKSNNISLKITRVRDGFSN